MEIAQLYIHPIKSLLPIPVQSVTVTPNGFRHDRAFLLIRILPDGTIGHMTIKETSELCLFQPAFSQDGKDISVSYTLNPSSTPITIPLEPKFAPDDKSYEVNIFGASATGYDMGPEIASFFSTNLGYPVRLLHIGSGHRSTPEMITPRPAPNPHPQGISFADVAPILLTTQASLDDISSRQEDQFDITKFRPNIFISTPKGTNPYDEEFWAEAEICSKDGHGQKSTDVVRLELTFNTARCQSINVDYMTGKQMSPAKQIYKKMTKDRRINSLLPYKPCFGRYAFCKDFGVEIHVGDEIKISKRNTERDSPV